MKKFIVGAFTPDSWKTHAEHWLSAVESVKGDATILVFNTEPTVLEGIECCVYDGTQAGLISILGKREGVFFFVAPHVRVQRSLAEFFTLAEDRVVTFGRNFSCVERPFSGHRPVHEDFWAAPSDLIDLLCRVIEMSFGTGVSPLHFDANYLGYFVEFFPWFSTVVPEGLFSHEFDADFSDDYYLSPDGERLVAVSLDVSSPGLFKLNKAALTTSG